MRHKHNRTYRCNCGNIDSLFICLTLWFSRYNWLTNITERINFIKLQLKQIYNKLTAYWSQWLFSSDLQMFYKCFRVYLKHYSSDSRVYMLNVTEHNSTGRVSTSLGNRENARNFLKIVKCLNFLRNLWTLFLVNKSSCEVCSHFIFYNRGRIFQWSLQNHPI